MKKINFMNNKDVFTGLLRFFLTRPPPLIPEDMRNCYDPEMVLIYNFFSKRQWDEIITKFNLENDAYTLELGITFLPRKVFHYYIPLYILASLYNREEYWVFEPDFIRKYLHPDYQDHDVFLDFVLGLSEEQLNIIAQFMSYESDVIKAPGVEDACKMFWNDYL